jgi:hypothetical protein
MNYQIKKFFFNRIKIIIIIIFLYKYFLDIFPLKIKKEIKIALCTVGRKENLYVQEFIEYYINLGIDHIFIYDDNDPNTEKISSVISPMYKEKITIYENLTEQTKYQSGVYNDCYKNNNNKYDWILTIIILVININD